MKIKEFEKLFNTLYDNCHLHTISDRRVISNRRDLSAMILLDRLCPSSKDKPIIVTAQDDTIWFSCNPTKVAKNATEEDIKDLIFYGVLYDEEQEGFYFIT
jgi:hypothetical protein